MKNIKHFGIHEIPGDVQTALASSQLPPPHRGPFDRIWNACWRRPSFSSAQEVNYPR
jgi:PIN domain nuclease of toxin-antitoxin system